MTSQPITSRGLKGYAGALAAGVGSALLFGFAVTHADTLFLFAAYFSAVPLFFAGLGGGVASSFLSSVAACLVLLFTQQAGVTLTFLFVYAVPVVILTAMALRYKSDDSGRIYWYPEGFLLTAIALFPIVFFLVCVASTLGEDGGLRGLTLTILNNALEPYKAHMDADMLLRTGDLMTSLANYLPTVLGISWSTIIALSMVVAQNSLRNQTWNLRPLLDYRALHVPAWLVYLYIAAACMAVLTPQPFSYIGLNLFFMLCIPFFCVGLAILHVWASTKKSSTVLLIVFYIVLSFMVWPAIFVTIAGALDQWLNFRKRLASGMKPIS